MLYKEKIRTYIKFCQSCHVDNRVYFVNLTFNGIFYLDLRDLSIHFLGRVFNEPANAIGVSIGINVMYKELLYFFPHNASVIIQYNRLTQIMQEIHIPDFEDGYFHTADVIVWQNRIYIFSAELSKGIYVYDLQKQEIRKDQALSFLFTKSQDICVNTFLTQNNCALLSLDGSNRLVEINLETGKIIQYRVVLPEGLQIYSVCFDGKHYWILPRNSLDIYEWDLKNNVVQIYRNENAEWDDNTGTSTVPYSNLVFLADEILVLNSGMREILRLNKMKKTIENPIPFPEGFRFVNSRFSGWPICDHYTVINDRVLFHPSRGNMLLIYDINSKQMSGKELLISQEDIPYLCDIITESFQNNRTIFERDELETLCNFVGIIGQNDIMIQSYSGKNIGNSIYHTLEEYAEERV